MGDDMGFEDFTADDYRSARNALLMLIGSNGPTLYRVILQALSVATYAMDQATKMTAPKETSDA